MMEFIETVPDLPVTKADRDEFDSYPPDSVLAGRLR